MNLSRKPIADHEWNLIWCNIYLFFSNAFGANFTNMFNPSGNDVSDGVHFSMDQN